MAGVGSNAAGNEKTTKEKKKKVTPLPKKRV